MSRETPNALLKHSKALLQESRETLDEIGIKTTIFFGLNLVIFYGVIGFMSIIRDALISFDGLYLLASLVAIGLFVAFLFCWFLLLKNYYKINSYDDRYFCKNILCHMFWLPDYPRIVLEECQKIQLKVDENKKHIEEFRTRLHWSILITILSVFVFFVFYGLILYFFS